MPLLNCNLAYHQQEKILLLKCTENGELTTHFLFLLINLYFIDKITVEALITINETGKGAIIPNISIQNSKVISSTLNILPLAGSYLYIENENKNINFYSKVFIVFFPVVIILIYQLIKKIIFL